MAIARNRPCKRKYDNLYDCNTVSTTIDGKDVITHHNNKVYKRYQRQAIQIARQLCYPQSVITQLETCTTQTSIAQVLSNARKIY